MRDPLLLPLQLLQNTCDMHYSYKTAKEPTFRFAQ